VKTLTGKVYLVGAGPGDPDLLTVKASALLRSADIVLYDDLVPPPVNVGKRCGAKLITQDEINRLMIGSARRGRNVIRLKSGDPAIFGRLGEELEALEAASVPFEVVPGVTAGLAAAASLSASLTDRRKSSSILIVSGHQARENERGGKNDWSALIRGDVTLVVYMPGHEFGSLVQELLEAGLPPETPGVIVSRVTSLDEQHHWTRLDRLSQAPRLKSPSILLIGRALERTGQLHGENVAGANGGSNAESISELIDLELVARTNANPERSTTF
jgi:uroporphyrin-III C-methyltransferase